jgi:hypothetical protein
VAGGRIPDSRIATHRAACHPEGSHAVHIISLDKELGINVIERLAKSQEKRLRIGCVVATLIYSMGSYFS